VVVAAVVSACGEDDFENRPREPVAVELTGVIQADKVTLSPNRVGAGPILITISNQTAQAHSVILEGEGIRERIGAINPQDTGTLQKTLKPGAYELRAGSPVAAPKEIEPAELAIGPQRPDSNDRLLLP
jgi:hypothetical protein